MSPQHHPPGTSRGGQFKAYSRGEMNEIALNEREESRFASYDAPDYRDYPDAQDLAEIEEEMRADERKRERAEQRRRAMLTPAEREAEGRATQAAWDKALAELDNNPEPPW